MILRGQKPAWAGSIFFLLIATPLFIWGEAFAEESNVKPGSPGYKVTIDGSSLPAYPAQFKGQINVNASESTPFWPPAVVPPKGAPNILLIMTDDVGFGAPSTFGGVIPTPALDKVADNGLKYTQFHSTALCSPTRAALITGRNHHSVGFGVITEISTGYPGYDSIITKDKASVAKILRYHGYATAWFGKNHNVPAFEATQVGPFDQWPDGMGFDYFYGFIGGDTSQWQPNLFRNTTPIYPYVGNPKWNLTTAMADDAIQWLKQLKSIAPDKPFFIYYVPGGTHAPHHPTPEWIEKFKGKFSGGWNALREEIFARQKKLGVIPENAQLTPWPKEILKEWETLTADEKKMFERQMEVYAAYLAYTDHEIGRVIEAVEEVGDKENTLIIYISGDNGSSAEGTPIGTPNEVAQFNGVEISVEQQLKDYYDVWGSDQTYNHMAVGWTWALDTPFKWTKQVASFFGGTRQGMAISWPKKIKDAKGIRNQFHHVIDIVPTILEAANIKAPNVVDGIAQAPIEGVSMVYTFDKSAKEKPSNHRTQYFEMLGSRALYHDGWVASTVPAQAPWDLVVKPDPDVADSGKWELYDLTTDWTQNNNVAEKYPKKLKELQELFFLEAAKYQVFPLDNSLSQRLLTERPSLTAGRTEFVYLGEVAGIPWGGAPNTLNKSYTITADVEIPAEGAEGVLVTQGGRFGGWGFYLLKGKPVFVYNIVDVERVRWEGKDAISPGKHVIAFDFHYDGGGFGKGGLGSISVDGKEVASHRIEHTLPFIYQWDETFDVGKDTGTPVDDKDYQVPFAFTGRLNKLTVNLKPDQLSTQDKALFNQKSQRSNSASE